jgi:hypothetical protein
MVSKKKSKQIDKMAENNSLGRARPPFANGSELPVDIQADAFQLNGTIYLFAFANCPSNGFSLSLAPIVRTADNQPFTVGISLSGPHAIIRYCDHPLASDLSIDPAALNLNAKINVCIEESFQIPGQATPSIYRKSLHVPIETDESKISSAEKAMVLSKTPGKVFAPPKFSEKEDIETVVDTPALPSKKTRDAWVKLGLIVRPVGKTSQAAPTTYSSVLGTYDDWLSEHCDTSCSKITDEGFGVKLCTQYTTVCTHLRYRLILNVSVMTIDFNTLSNMVGQSLQDATILAAFAGVATIFASEGNVELAYADASATFVGVLEDDLADRIEKISEELVKSLRVSVTPESDWV